MKITVDKDFRNVSGEYEFMDDTTNIIIGKNGCGKSSLMKSIVATYKKSSGNILDIQEMYRQDLKGLVEIDKNFDNIVYMSKDDDFNLSSDAFTSVQRGLLKYKNLSSGQQFLDMFQTSLVEAIKDSNNGKTTLLMFDEIDAHFDLENQKYATDLLSKINRFPGITILYTTHHLGIMLKLKKVYNFETKQIIKPSEILEKFI